MSTYTHRVSSPAVPDLVGEVIDGRYEVLEHLADGGMAVVYRALDTRLDREVALKVMRPHLVHDLEFVRRFEREARSAARLSHPHIVGVLDQGDDAGHLFIALEYVPGRTLRDVLDEEGSLTPRAALDILDPALDALGYAHRAGLVHRDVKPENILIRDDGVVKVADFGLVRAVTSQTVTSSSSVLLGTVAYVSPEQVGRGIADARSDVYAAGLILYEMLAGEKAYGGDTPVNVAFQHVHEDVPELAARAVGVPPMLDDAIATASARDPDERPADATALRALLGEVRRGLSSEQLDRHIDSTGPGRGTSSRTAVLPVAAKGAATAPLPTAKPSGPSSTKGSGPAPTQGIGRATDRPVPPNGPEPHSGDTGRRRRRWPWVLVVLSALLLGGTVWAFTEGPFTPTPIPKVAGIEVGQVHADLTALGLTYREQEAFSEDVPAGHVISSNPVEGTTVWKSSTVHLIVSKGPERYAVPSLAGAALDSALGAITDNHLTAGTIAQEFSEEVAEGHVISSDPVADTALPPGGVVNLVVSKGRQPIPLSDWTGKPYGDAEAALTEAGLAPVNSGTENSDTIPKGSIIRQDPAPGQYFLGQQVSFIVSDGPALFAVPDVVGRQVDAATATLKAAGFEVRVQKLLPGINFGTVQSMDPGAGTMLPKGSTITLKTV